MGGTWFNSLFSLPFKLTKAGKLICRYVEADSQRYSCKIILWIYAANLHERFLDEELSPMHSLLSKQLNAPHYFPLLKCKIILQVVWIINDTLVHIQPVTLKIGAFKKFETKF